MNIAAADITTTLKIGTETSKAALFEVEVWTAWVGDVGEDVKLDVLGLVSARY